MRISDWSSDVCSSDLFATRSADSAVKRRTKRPARVARTIVSPAGTNTTLPPGTETVSAPASISRAISRSGTISAYSRSEEHTSELQSLMRISYAVFCLTKKLNQMNNINVRQLATQRNYLIVL